MAIQPAASFDLVVWRESMSVRSFVEVCDVCVHRRELIAALVDAATLAQCVLVLL